MARAPARVIVVANPVSGGGRSEALLEGALEGRGGMGPLAAALGFREGEGAIGPVVRTTADGSWRQEVRDCLDVGDVRAVMAIGGDGTLMELASLLYANPLHETGTRIALGIQTDDYDKRHRFK